MFIFASTSNCQVFLASSAHLGKIGAQWVHESMLHVFCELLEVGELLYF